MEKKELLVSKNQFFLLSLIMSFLISNFFLKKHVLDDFQAFFDAKKIEIFS